MKPDQIADIASTIKSGHGTASDFGPITREDHELDKLDMIRERDGGDWIHLDDDFDDDCDGADDE